jgi:hypothetical protein
MLFSAQPREGPRLKWARRSDDGVGMADTAIDSGYEPGGFSAIERGLSHRREARALDRKSFGRSGEMT